MKKNKKILISALTLFFLLVISLGTVYMYNHRVVVSGLDAQPFMIGHAMGGLEDGNYSNSLEAFETNYKKGIRVFEADFSVTSDNVLILRHDWTKSRGQKGLIKYEGYIPTYEEFMYTPLYGKYTPLSCADLIELMLEYEDIYVVTDTKDGEYDKVVTEFQMILDCATKLDALSCLDRFIVQLYNDEMYDAVVSVYPFKSMIYTVYQRGTDNFEQLCQFCVEKQIPVITINQKKYKEELQHLADQYDLKIYLHTVNDKKDARNFYKAGVDGFYTDKLTGASFP